MPRSDTPAILQLLAEEHEALLSGRLDRLGEIAAQKAPLTDDLAALRLTRDQAIALRDAAARNARLLQAALKGVKTAQDRLKAIRAVRDGLQIYEPGGTRRTVTASGTALARKA